MGQGNDAVIRVGFDETGPWRHELTDLVRAVSGGLLFGVPLLYTMEVWWTGSQSSPAQTGLVLALLFVPAFLLNKTAGFRTSRDVRTVDAAADTVETVAIGIVVTTAVLFLLRQITAETPPNAIIGMVLYESVPFCLGVGVARHFLRGSRDADDNDGGRRGSSGRTAKDHAVDGTVADLGATAIGAVFISLSIAPTDEVPMIVSAMDPAWVLAFMVVSLLVSYAIVFAAGFSGQERRAAQVGILQRPLTETVACYLVALAISGLMLWLFQRGLDTQDNLTARIVILGLPAAVGGAAGRLAI